MVTREDARRVHELLERALGRPIPHIDTDPIGGLILAILSQNTNDTNRDRAFKALRERFPEWTDLVKAAHADVAHAIRVAGLWKTKSCRILECLKLIEQKLGGLSLEFIRSMSVNEAEECLCSLPGVGVKTARCVMLFQFGIPAFPVDTHVLRVARRLRWVSSRATSDEAHRVLQELVPPELVLPLHLNLVRLGRTFCRPRRPRCADCPLFAVCPTGRETSVGVLG